MDVLHTRLTDRFDHLAEINQDSYTATARANIVANAATWIRQYQAQKHEDLQRPTAFFLSETQIGSLYAEAHYEAMALYDKTLLMEILKQERNEIDATLVEMVEGRIGLWEEREGVRKAIKGVKERGIVREQPPGSGVDDIAQQGALVDRPTSHRPDDSKHKGKGNIVNPPTTQRPDESTEQTVMVGQPNGQGPDDTARQADSTDIKICKWRDFKKALKVRTRRGGIIGQPTSPRGDVAAQQTNLIDVSVRDWRVVRPDRTEVLSDSFILLPAATEEESTRWLECLSTAEKNEQGPGDWFRDGEVVRVKRSMAETTERKKVLQVKVESLGQEGMRNWKTGDKLRSGQVQNRIRARDLHGEAFKLTKRRFGKKTKDFFLEAIGQIPSEEMEVAKQ